MGCCRPRTQFAPWMCARMHTLLVLQLILPFGVACVLWQSCVDVQKSGLLSTLQQERKSGTWNSCTLGGPTLSAWACGAGEMVCMQAMNFRLSYFRLSYILNTSNILITQTLTLYATMRQVSAHRAHCYWYTYTTYNCAR